MEQMKPMEPMKPTDFRPEWRLEALGQPATGSSQTGTLSLDELETL